VHEPLVVRLHICDFETCEWIPASMIAIKYVLLWFDSVYVWASGQAHVGMLQATQDWPCGFHVIGATSRAVPCQGT
jgi:hypothetical protein